MRKTGMNPGLITGANHVNDRVCDKVSTPGCITLPPRYASIRREPQDGTYGASAFMHRVRADTPENERELRGTPQPITRRLLQEAIHELEIEHPGDDVRGNVARMIQSGLVEVY